MTLPPSPQPQRPGLPLPSADQAYVTVSVLDGGSLTLPDHHFVHPAASDLDETRTVPSLCFLLTHPQCPSPHAVLGRSDVGIRHTRGGDGKDVESERPKPVSPFRCLFDLGLRRDIERFPVELQQHLELRRQPYTLGSGIEAQMRREGLKAREIDAVILSHIHYDHHGDPEDFPTSTMVVGPGTLDVLRHGLPGKGPHMHFDPALFASNVHVLELPPLEDVKWQPLGPFEAALNLFGDGTVYVLHMPGHLPGHVGLLCRLSSTRWVCLCGDAFHDPRLLSGEKAIATWKDEDGSDLCIHHDRDEAGRTIEKLRRLRDMAVNDGVELVLVAAHDEVWLAQNRHCLFPGQI